METAEHQAKAQLEVRAARRRAEARERRQAEAAALKTAPEPQAHPWGLSDEQLAGIAARMFPKRDSNMRIARSTDVPELKLTPEQAEKIAASIFPNRKKPEPSD